MHLTVNGKQIDIGDALRVHVDESLQSIVHKYFDRAIEATVVFSREAHLFRADATLHASKNVVLQSTGHANDAYLAFDQAAEKLAKRLRRYKRRLRDHSRGTAAEMPAIEASSQVIESGPDEDDAEFEAPEQPVVVAEMMTTVDSMTVSQAVMRLDLEDRPALMFRNPAHGGLNMVYRRADGNIGWVDPRGSRADGA